MPIGSQIRAILYARISRTTNKASLDGQLNRMRQFAAAKGYTVVDERKEIASGLNENRKQLLPLLSRQDYDVLIIEHKDRLSRFGSTYIEQALINNGVKLEIINKIENKDNELIDDFVSIITSFCGHIYGRKRKTKTQEIIVSSAWGLLNSVKGLYNSIVILIQAYKTKRRHEMMTTVLFILAMLDSIAFISLFVTVCVLNIIHGIQ